MFDMSPDAFGDFCSCAISGECARRTNTKDDAKVFMEASLPICVTLLDKISFCNP
jgi:hypothetical protein